MKYLTIFIATFLFAFSMHAKYEAKYGIFGTIAKADGCFFSDGKNYKIVTFAYPIGLVSALSKHMKQQYISYGIVKNGVLIPSAYISHRSNDKKDERKMFVFDHKHKKLIMYKYKFDKLVSIEEKPYLKEDVLSLYFNLKHYLKEKKHYTFYALGGRKKDGRVDVDVLYKDKNITKIKGNLYNKVFAGDKGVVFFTIRNKDWVVLKGVVKNVLKIGDLKGSLKEFDENTTCPK